VTLDQSPWSWLVLAALAPFGRSLPRPGTPALLLGASGAALLLAGMLGLPVSAWLGSALFRAGCLLGSAVALTALVERAIGAGWRPPLRLPADAPRLLMTVALAAGLPGSLLAWWDPVRSDPQVPASTLEVSPAFEPVGEWIRRETPPGAVFMASADWAPQVLVRGGRPVLQARSLWSLDDEPLRTRVEGALLAGRPLPPAAPDYGVRYVFAAPGDFRARGIEGPEALEGVPGLALRYAGPHRFRVYEVVR
jgi:hypothetical protein